MRLAGRTWRWMSWLNLDTMTWCLKGVAAVWLIAQIAPAPQHVLLDAPQTVVTNAPQLCVHTRLIDEVPEFRMQQSLRAVREMGAGTIVEFFPWAYVERRPGQDDWSQPDKIFKHARNQGIRVIARLGLVPEWARQREDGTPTTFNELPAESYDNFAAYAARFTARYRDDLAAIIVWNEPNLTFEWGFRPVSPVEYTALLAATTTAVRAAAPDVTILAGALAATLEPAGSANGLEDILYLRGILDAGAAAYFDGLAVHSYGLRSAALDAPARDRLNFRRVELLRDVLDEYGLDEMKVWITEFGWNDHPRWAGAVSPAQRVINTLDAYRWADAQWPWLAAQCLWVFRYPTPANSYPDGFVLATTDFDLKPLYFALQTYATGSAP